jgi:uncharacterized protein (DUF362 family)
MRGVNVVAVSQDEAASYAIPATVEALVRSALQTAGCDSGNVGTSRWNPFGDFARPGERIHVLPNFVSHRRGFETTEEAFLAKVTHASVLEPILEYAIRAAGSADLVSIGNAPIQGCNFEKVTGETGTRALLERLSARGDRVRLTDLRGVRSVFEASGALRERVETGEPMVEIDLGTDSLLEPLYRNGARPAFRVADYPGEATEAYHGPGRHVYVVNARVLQAGLIVSVPKLKAHEKVGLTCALKGTVGAIARKECLAHHRHGAPRAGGDEISRDQPLASLTSSLLEYVSNKPINAWSNALRVAATFGFRAFRVLAPGTMGGAWHGNDTAWRMALDIARVLRYATPDGRMAETPQREHIAVIDGIIAGEGDGPLHPRPRHDGAILFGADPCLVDWACAHLLGWDPARIPLLREAFAPMRYPLTDQSPEQMQILLSGAPTTGEGLADRFAPAHLPPSGWRAHLQKGPPR